MYKSPIEVVYGQLQTKFEGDVVKAVQSYNINVDKEELIKALAYDRGQYEAGYMDARSTITRCADCQHCALEYTDQGFGYPSRPTRVCIIHDHENKLDDYCSWAKRKDEGE